MDNNQRLIWLGGEILPVNEAKINILSPTSQFGLNVFEGVRCYWSESAKQLYAFRLKDHIKRLHQSIKLMRMNSPSWNSCEPVNMFIAPIAKQFTPITQKKGLRCQISSWERISDRNLSPRAKVGANYINSRMAYLQAVEDGYDTALFLNSQGKVSEGPGSCFFMVRDHQLYTPPVTASVLESITRDTIIRMAKEMYGLEVVIRDIDRTELYICDEAFLCGSAMEITHITDIDGYTIADGNLGEITHQLSDSYYEIVTGQISQYKDWLTPIY